MTQWISGKLGFPLRIVAHGPDEKLVELKNIEESIIDDALFELPKGFSAMEESQPKAEVQPEEPTPVFPEWVGDVSSAKMVTLPFEQVIKSGEMLRIKVEDGKRASDYAEGVGYEFGYYGTSTTAYDIDYASGGTARTVTADDFYYLDNTEHASAGYGGVVVAMPERGAGTDLDYGGRVHFRFGPLACMLTQG